VRIFCGQGVLQMRTSALFGVKNIGFLKFVVCLHGQGERGLSQCGHFADKGKGVNFSRTSFTGGHLC